MSDSSWGRVTGLAGFAWVTALGLAPGAVAQTAPSVAPSTPPAPARVAQLLYPSADESPSIKVMGRGEASMAADTTKITFSLTTFNPAAYVEAEEVTFDPESLGGSSETSPAVEAADINLSEGTEMEGMLPVPLTRSALKSILAVIQKAGVLERNITVEIPDGGTEGTVQIVLEKPSADRVKTLTDAVELAIVSAENPLYLSDTQTRFEIRDCQPLEVKAYESAIANARRSATTLAKVLGTSLSGTPRVAESPFDLFSPTSCNETSPLTELMNIGGIFGNAAPPKAEVMIKRDLFVTFPVR